MQKQKLEVWQKRNYTVNFDYPYGKNKVKLGLYIIPCTKMNCSRLNTKGSNSKLETFRSKYRKPSIVFFLKEFLKAKT